MENWSEGEYTFMQTGRPYRGKSELVGKKKEIKPCGLITAGKRPFPHYIIRGRRLLEYFAEYVLMVEKEYALLIVLSGLLW